MRTFTIGSRRIDDTSPPYVIAEIGVNHGGALALAHTLVDLAHQAGADAVKFQSYKADRLAAEASPAYWDTTKEATPTQRELFRKYDGLNPDDYRALAAQCRALGIDFLSTPFDEEAVEFLAPLMPVFKVASADITNIPLLRRIARQRKPVVLSVGASTVDEIDRALDELTGGGTPGVALLHCVLNYPTPFAAAHLNMIEGLARRYPGRLIGYSDHTVPDPAMTVLTTAYLKGARVIEKHFTHDKSLPGNDHYHAMDADDLRTFRRQLTLIAEISGQSEKTLLANEEPARRHARRSIVVDRPVTAGSVLTDEMLTCKRPGTGISPSEWDRVVGRRAARDLEGDRLLRWDDLAPLPSAEGRPAS